MAVTKRRFLGRCSYALLPDSILSSTARAIGVVDNSTVLNQEMASASGLNAFGISRPGNCSTLANQGTVTAAGSRGFGLDARGSNSTLINSGTINVSGPKRRGSGRSRPSPRPFSCSARPGDGAQTASLSSVFPISVSGITRWIDRDRGPICTMESSSMTLRGELR